MVKCPKCQKQLPWTKFVFSSDSYICPTCHARLEPVNRKSLEFISIIFAALIVLLGAGILKATGHDLDRPWNYAAFFLMFFFIQMPLRCFFLRINIKGREDRLLNL